MRLIPTAIFCASMALPGLAHAQANKVQGASLAGLCAASLDFVAGARNAAGVAQPSELLVFQNTRDLYLGTSKFKTSEVEAYAKAWSQRMSENFSQAADESARSAVAADIGKIARDCQTKLVEQYRAAQARGEIPANPPAVVQPAPIQPLTVQPLETQPLTLQPLETQPLTITPQ